MIGWRELHRAAVHERTLRGDETDRRRAVSALYYALFHRLCSLGAGVFAPGGTELQAKVKRGFNHGPMLNVCKHYLLASKNGRFGPELAWQGAVGPGPELAAVASAFIQLQQGRHLADYDLEAELSSVEHLRLLFIAEHAHWQLDEIERSEELVIFVSALLLHDKWARRG